MTPLTHKSLYWLLLLLVLLPCVNGRIPKPNKTANLNSSSEAEPKSSTVDLSFQKRPIQSAPEIKDPSNSKTPDLPWDVVYFSSKYYRGLEGESPSVKQSRKTIPTEADKRLEKEQADALEAFLHFVRIVMAMITVLFVVNLIALYLNDLRRAARKAAQNAAAANNAANNAANKADGVQDGAEEPERSNTPLDNAV